MKARSLLPVVCGLLLLAGTEATIVYLQGTTGTGYRPLVDALRSGLFVLAGFGLFFAIAAFTRLPEPFRRLLRATCLLLVVTFSVALFLPWVAFWITGRPTNPAALAVLAGSPFTAARHLWDSDTVLLVLIAVAMAAFVTVITWLLGIAMQGGNSIARPVRLLLTVLFASLLLLSSREIHGSLQTRSSFAALLGARPAPLPAGLAYACPRSPSVPITSPMAGLATSSTPANATPIIVIMVESLRADLLTQHPDSMPFLADLAHHSAVFDRAYAASSHSDYGDLAFWYSRYPRRAEGRLGYPVNAAWRGISVFEYFKQRGYSTAYFSSQNELWGDMINWLKIPAVDTYFDSENFAGDTWMNEDDEQGLAALVRSGRAHAGKVEDSHTLGLAGAWIQKHATTPFFVGLNLQNTHYNYFIAANGEHPFQPDVLGFRAVYSAWPREQAAVVRNRYLNAAWNVDAALRAFAARLQRAGVWDRALVLIIGDSGEAFYEHGYGNHSGPMYEEEATTLALLKLPRGDARNGTHWAAPVSHIDFVPLLLDAVHAEPWPGFQGTSPWQRPTEAPVYLSVDAIVGEDGVVRWPWKLLSRYFPGHTVELFNLAEDPDESSDLHESEASVARAMLDDLESFRSCQLGYYRDPAAHTRLQPPRYFRPEPQDADVRPER